MQYHLRTLLIVSVVVLIVLGYVRRAAGSKVRHGPGLKQTSYF